jgi:membrane-bound lytic murein transglycosylase B
VRAAGWLLAAVLGGLWQSPARALDTGRADIAAFVDEVVSRDHLDRDWVLGIIAAAESKASIVEAMSRPAERVKPWFEYRKIFLTEKRIREGREFYAEHRALLDRVAAHTGVPGELITAIIGVETSYGRLTGRYRVLDALATLAFDYPPRASYFRGELEQFLLLAHENGIDPLKATGSYAGAMGAAQFMPRSYRRFARDGDHDGRIDLWNDWPDIVESVAHYFAANGWRRGEPIVFDAELTDPDVEGLTGNGIELTETAGELRRRGVVFDAAVNDAARATLIALRDGDRPVYRVGVHNFWVITRYNRSALYALAATELARAIVAPDAPPAPPGNPP